MGEEGEAAITQAVSPLNAPYFPSKVGFSKIATADAIFSLQIIVHHGHKYGVIILVYVSFENIVNLT